VLPALLRKAHEAKARGDAELVVWGSGSPRREFLHVDDLADACVHLIEVYRGEAVDDASPWINVGCGADLTVAELAEKVRTAVGFEGRLRFDPARPDGAPRKLLDVARLSGLGWRARIPLDQGLGDTYRWYLEHVASRAPRTRDGPGERKR
jgi:GDP-L-fucose synthase